MTDQHAHHMSHPTGGVGVTLDTDGFRLTNVTAPDTIGTHGEIQFTILDPHGHAATDFEIAHQQELHLVIVRADGSHFAHVHPHRDDTGIWHLPWTWEAAGTYRLYTDIVPTAAHGPMTLSTTVQVAGDFAPESFDTASTTSTVDGFTVELLGEVTAGEHSPVTISVTREVCATSASFASLPIP